MVLTPPHRGYEELQSWEPPLTAFLTNRLPKAKAKCSPNDLRKLRDTICSMEKDEYTIVIYTDGSVNPVRHRGSVMGSLSLYYSPFAPYWQMHSPVQNMPCAFSLIPSLLCIPYKNRIN